ncbi:hypothetical protein Droror1_Dr00011788 [Drosera rotundifolia]
MDNVLIPVLGIAAAAAATFYLVSFSELSEVICHFSNIDEFILSEFHRLLPIYVSVVCLAKQKSFRDLDEKEAAEEEEDGFSVSMTPRSREARGQSCEEG